MADKEEKAPVDIIKEIVGGRYNLLPANRVQEVADAIIERLDYEGLEIKKKGSGVTFPEGWPYGYPNA